MVEAMPFFLNLCMSGNAVKLFKRKLTNLSSANPQLWITRLKADFHFDFKELEFARILSGPVFLDHLLSGKKEIILCPLLDVRDNSVNQLAQKLGNVARKQKLIFQERGVDELYISFPFVTGQWPDGSWVRTPFLLIPVKLERDLKNWILYPALSDAVINPSFLLAYAFHFRVSLEQQFYDRGIEIQGTDALSFLTAFYNVLKESKIDVLFNQDLFLRQIEPIKPILKDYPLTDYSPGKLKLEPNCVLGIFPQSDSVLVPDFDFIETEEVSLEDIFLKHVDGPKEISEKNLFCPLPVDGSQEDAIKKVKSGQSLVVQGPPGTGKSQLIANLMADAMGMGHSVLLVCQKRIALEVVQNRLDSVGLGRFVGLWSDYKKDREPVYNQIRESIDGLSENEAKNMALDTVVLERNFQKVCTNIDQISQKLETWKTALYETNSAGISVKELYSLGVDVQVEGFVSGLFLKFKYEEWSQFLTWISRYWEEIEIVCKAEFTFKNRKNWYLKEEASFAQLPEKWSIIAAKFQVLEKAYHKLIKAGSTDKDFSVLLKKRAPIHTILSADIQLSANYSYLVFDFKKFVSGPEFLSEAFEQWAKIDAICRNQGSWPIDLEINISEIDGLLNDIHKYEKYFQVPLIKPFAIFFNKKIAAIARYQSYFPNKETWLEDFKNSLSNSKMLAYLSIDFLQKEIKIFDGSQFDNLVYRYAQFVKDHPELKRYQQAFLNISILLKDENKQEYPAFQKTSLKLEKQAAQLEELLKDWNIDFELEHSAFLIAEFNKSEQFIGHFENHKTKIRLMDQQLLSVPPHWKSLAEEISNWNGMGLNIDAISSMLNASWARHWIHKLEQQEPLLASMDKQIWHSDLKLLRDSIEEKRKIVSSILELRLSENAYKDLEVNRLGNRLTYRGLYHQVSKKRLRAPLRQLWHDHEDEIKKIIPAWLATPESVSATWPISTKFDLVIFDESSQCFAERGIPSAYRANQIVIVGDDKQLPPNQLFSARWEENENEEDAVFFEQNSLLDLARQFLPQVMLKGHYRSSFPELISFSNQYFYNRKLEFLPDASAFKERPPALHWKKVSGTWLDQQNLEEAREVANSVFSFIDAHPMETLGIITFNAKQQALIEREIDIKSVSDQRMVPDWLFVKNIENVQGDERDHIWFSIAYAKNEKEKVVAQFGTLSQPGGENRLNVAVTRARKSITVFSSILPAELPANDRSPEGPKLLKLYLAFVFTIAHQADMEEFFSFDENKTGQPIVTSLESTWILKDGAPLYDANSMKDYFGYKYLTLTAKGYDVQYVFSRK